MSKHKELVTKLKEIFQIDKPELDFGIYRIINMKAKEIETFLNERLLEKVKNTLGTDATPEQEDLIFSHVITFFSRYYDNGDFISKRRYKGETYSLPYAGEEVVLYWANKDQYYTKSSESFSNYSFKLSDGRKVNFQLVSAETEKDNRKGNENRKFILLEATNFTKHNEFGEEISEERIPIEEINNELVIKFEFKIVDKNPKQEALIDNALDVILGSEIVKNRWNILSNELAPTEKHPNRTFLEKHLNRYTEKNTADYFVHKNLNAFLRSENDFYIKNEMMNLDDFYNNANTFSNIENNFKLIKSFREISIDIISFLSQIENFQKKLWLKKKFIVECQYCITLDKLPTELYTEIANNKSQWEQWLALGFFESYEVGDVKKLIDNQFWQLDTSLFDLKSKYKFISALTNLDDSIDGLIIDGDNFQAMNLLQERFKSSIGCVYTDPPYNTKSTDFLYKDTYKHSSWASMMLDRITLCKKLMSPNGVFSHYIDENEHKIASFILDEVFGNENKCGEIIWKNSSKNDQNFISMQHEYLLVAVNDKLKNLGEWKERKEGLDEIYKAFDSFKREHGNNWKAIHESMVKWYGQYPESSPITDSKHYSWMDEKGVYFASDISGPNYGQYRYDVIHPATGKKCKQPASGWRFPESTMKERILQNLVHFGENEETIPNNKTYLKDTEYHTLTSMKYRDGRVGSKLLGNLFGQKAFTNPKDVDLSMRFLKSFEVSDTYILDFFAGTGTTAHAAISLTRQDNLKRKYILVEQGEYFYSVLIPRIKKNIYCSIWKDGKPMSKVTGVTHAFKILKLESYEDTLNNLEFKREHKQESLISKMEPNLKDDYLLNYSIDIESRNSLLSVESFTKPFDYYLKISATSSCANGEKRIDLIETFNYLIGLKIRKITANLDLGYLVVEGNLSDGDNSLILWRDCTVINNEALNALCKSPDFSFDLSKYSVVYVNGDHNLKSIFESETKANSINIKQIETEFLAKMFETEEA